ncbi:signal transduction histidine kinase [Streptosporangium becharense]|uniref:histidine kinase n=1 Tax=Streptosporangium becharense TaxID=1816182 RepID=A0A7W9ICE3_9ACTN|nr:sensor histidine kinase [Streptosporangium becharense]MBB2913765.1 signal transduction histidine kinase [Streptosporangium becharense]MBB5817846.1 signal transduction histidine kinase [Streptosporangium becharense]
MRNTTGSLRARFREHPRACDAALAVALAVAAVPCAYVTPLFGAAPPREPDALSLTLIVAGCLSAALRGGRPFLALTLVCLAQIAPAMTGRSTSLLWLVTLVLVYSIAAHRGLAVSLGAPALGLAAHLASAALGGRLGDVRAHLPVAVLIAAAWIVGRNVRLRRAYQAELGDRARRMERAREADRRAARAEERSRIARELHDVVAHHVSVMTVQASAARRVLAADPGRAGEALSAIEELGRTAMTEMRSMVGVLRTDAAPAERTPQPGVAEIPALVDQMSEAGLRTRLCVEGEPGTLSPGVDLAAYRLVQEALTNSLRHAGPRARAWVTLRHGPGELTVRVEDDGRGPATRDPGAGPDIDPDAEPGGHGLTGIRERVALYGGILRIGPRPGGGFEVNARFPLKDRR